MWGCRVGNIITITPSVLSWARKTIGYSEDQVVEHLKAKRVTLDVFKGWELGMEQPTYPQLKKLAKLYKRPVALFFFPEPPEEKSIREDFRALPPFITKSIPPNILYLVRKAKARQMDLEELHGGITDKAKIVTLRKTQKETAKILADRIRNETGIAMKSQTEWKDFENAFKNWRSAIENLGVWVFKEPFKNDDYCGFCVDDDHFPVIYVNNSQVPQRQIFTLFHELGHLLTGKAGVDFRSVPAFEGVYQEEEIFCNSFAGSFLVPENELNHYTSKPDDELVKDLARKYKVSFDVILRKFLDRGIIDNKTYSHMITEQTKKFHLAQLKKSEKKKGGGDYYFNQRVYLGNKYIELALEKYHRQHINKQQLADYLDIKVTSVSSLEDVFHGLLP